jgi:hypothetical protein
MASKEEVDEMIERLEPYIKDVPAVVAALRDGSIVDPEVRYESARDDYRGPITLYIDLTRYYHDIKRFQGQALADAVVAFRTRGGPLALPETWDTTPRAWRAGRL